MNLKNIFVRNMRREQRGSVLVVALWAVFLLGMYAMQLGAIVRQKLALMDRLDNRSQLHFIAEAGVQRAFAVLRSEDVTLDSDALNESWGNSQATFHNISVGKGTFDVVAAHQADGQIRYGMVDEESKLNINTATVDVLARLLVAQGGLEPDNALELANTIIDWRDADSFYQHPQYGAEDDDYKSLSPSYESKDADFEIPEELLLVKGMTRDVFKNIKDFITVYSEGSININTVGKEVLSAYGLNDSLADRITSFRRGDDALEGTADDGVFKQPAAIVSELSQVSDLSINDVAGLENFISVFGVATTSDTFMVRSLARLAKNNQELEIDAVVDRDGQVHYWREEYGRSTDHAKQTKF